MLLRTGCHCLLRLRLRSRQTLQRLSCAANDQRATDADQVRWSLQEILTGQTQCVAKDVTLTVTFRPTAVIEYRLLGHEAHVGQAHRVHAVGDVVRYGAFLQEVTEEHLDGDEAPGQAAARTSSKSRPFT